MKSDNTTGAVSVSYAYDLNKFLTENIIEPIMVKSYLGKLDDRGLFIISGGEVRFMCMCSYRQMEGWGITYK